MWRTRWAALGAAVAVTVGAGGLGIAGAAIDSGDKPVTITVEATRLLDTRIGIGLAGRFVDAAPRELQITGTVPVAPSGTRTVVPDGAVGVLVNVAVVAPGSSGFLSLRTGGASGFPTTSTVNYLAGINTPNAASRIAIAGVIGVRNSWGTNNAALSNALAPVRQQRPGSRGRLRPCRRSKIEQFRRGRVRVRS